MGYSYYNPYTPKMCFNGAKSFNFGWYSSRTETLKIFTTNSLAFTKEYTLIGTADYQNPNNDASSLVVVKLETGSPDFYIYFNRKIGINSEVREYGDHVMVVSQGDNPSQSWIVATFNTTGSYIITNAGGSKFDITVAVSSINLLSNPAKATVSVTRTRSGQTVSLDNDKLRGAVSQWIQNRTVALVAFGNITEWNTENVTNMDYLFYKRLNFNADISRWNVGRVTSMRAMFNGARSFNKNISKWNVGRVTNMYKIFYNASVFNVSLSSWNMSSVMDLSMAFEYASKFNGDVSRWNVERVTRMYGIFFNASAFNKNISAWNVAQVTDMSWAFGYASNFNSQIGYWNINRVSDLSYMFYRASKFNQSLCWTITGKDTTNWLRYSSGSLAPSTCRQ
jgi:surface protein